MPTPTKDADGLYPSEESLTAIREWPLGDLAGLMVFIKALWWAADWGWREFDGKDDFDKPIHVYWISTGGWSGNEELIAALQESQHGIHWSQLFREHHVGGHYMLQTRITS